jgi:hypothetical protein
MKRRFHAATAERQGSFILAALRKALVNPAACHT